MTRSRAVTIAAMKAVRIHEDGGPEVLRYEDAPDPTPKAGEVLVHLRAASLNRLDLWVRSCDQSVAVTIVVGDQSDHAAAAGNETDDKQCDQHPQRTAQTTRRTQPSELGMQMRRHHNNSLQPRRHPARLGGE